MLRTGIRRYSTQNNQSKSILSFLERMDKLHAGEKKTRGVDLAKIKNPNRPQQQTNYAKSNHDQKKRPYREGRGNFQRQSGGGGGGSKSSQRQPGEQTTTTTTTKSAPRARPQSARQNMLKSDDYDMMAMETSGTKEKLDMHVTPKTIGSTKRFDNRNTAGTRRAMRSPNPRTNNAGPMRQGNVRSYPDRVKNRTKQQVASGGNKAQRTQKWDQKTAPQQAYGGGSIYASEALDILHRRLANPGNNRGYMHVDQLNAGELVPSFNGALTFEGRLWSSAKQAYQTDNVPDAVKHSFKGITADQVPVPATTDFASQSAATSVSYRHELSPQLKSTLVDIASGRTPVSALRK